MWNLNRRWRDGVGRLTSRSQAGHRSGQSQPLFFSKLPLEIRFLIYRHVFPVCNEAIHVGVLLVPGKTKYFFNPCLGSSFEDWEYDDNSSGLDTHFSGRIHKDCHEEFEERRKEQYQWIKSKRIKRAIPNSVVSLMLTCTKIKSEVESEFYSNLRFILFDDMIFVGPADSFLSTISRSALESIKSIKVQFQAPGSLCAGLDKPSGYATFRAKEDWLRFCQLLANATTLQNLQIIIFDRGVPYSETILLQPLQPLRIPNFTVQLPWPRDYHPNRQLASDEGHPFKILRPCPEQMLLFEEQQPPFLTAGIDHVNRRPRRVCAILRRCCCCCLGCC